MQAMPTIIVMSTSTTEHDGAITLREDVQPAHLASGHHAAQLIERVGWAVTDAKDTEGGRSSAIER
jgi:hypothetical protein